MPTEITVPDLGESVYEATIANWLKKEGDRVTVGEAVVELETDKVDLEVGATEDGILKSIRANAGQDVQVGDVLAVIEPAEEEEEKPTPEEPEEPEKEKEEEPAPEETEEPKEEKEEKPERATPVARRYAQETGVDLEKITGTGAGGRITKEDVEKYLDEERKPEVKPEPEKKPKEEAKPSPPEIEIEAREERVRMSRRRRTIANRLVEAQQNAAILTTFNDVDMSAVIDLRARRRDSFREKHDIKLGFMSFFVKATIGALKEFPRLNAEIDGDEIILKYHYDIGIAIGAEEGLVVPVLRDADHMTFAEIERNIDEFITKVREKSLTIEELQGGTFSITNGGVFGSLLSTPILNPPQVGILGMHRIEERPMAIEGRVIIRPMMYLALSYDHRIVDGREAVLFLYRIKELIEDPERLLLEG